MPNDNQNIPRKSNEEIPRWGWAAISTLLAGVVLSCAGMVNSILNPRPPIPQRQTLLENVAPWDPDANRIPKSKKLDGDTTPSESEKPNLETNIENNDIYRGAKLDSLRDSITPEPNKNGKTPPQR